MVGTQRSSPWPFAWLFDAPSLVLLSVFFLFHALLFTLPVEAFHFVLLAFVCSDRDIADNIACPSWVLKAHLSEVPFRLEILGFVEGFSGSAAIILFTVVTRSNMIVRLARYRIDRFYWTEVYRLARDRLVR